MNFSGKYRIEDGLHLVKAVLFDMDGTLFNTEEIHTCATLAVYYQLIGDRQGDCPLPNAEELIGKSDADVFERIIAPCSAVSCAEFVKLKNWEMLKAVDTLSLEQLTALMTKGIVPLLKRLRDRRIKMAIVTASEPEVAEVLLSKSGLSPYFEMVINYNSTAYSKPSPSPYLLAMRKLGVNSGETLIFEDSLTGLAAAKATKSTTVQVQSFLPPKLCQHNLAITDFR